MRKEKIKRLILVLIVLTFVTCLFLFFTQSPKSYRVNETEFSHSKITSQISGTKIAFISDINLTDEKSFERFKKIIEEFNANLNGGGNTISGLHIGTNVTDKEKVIYIPNDANVGSYMNYPFYGFTQNTDFVVKFFNGEYIFG